MKPTKVMGINPEVALKVNTFYYYKDISYTFPGKRDYMMVQEDNGKRIKMVKHVLTLTLREASTSSACTILMLKSPWTNSPRCDLLMFFYDTSSQRMSAPVDIMTM